mgnify:CR=1 FL=1
MRLHRNIAVGIIEGLENILFDKRALKPVLNRLLKKNQKWGARDRKFVFNIIIEIVRWKRKLTEIGKLDINSKNFLWELLGLWLITNKIELPNWKEFSVLGNQNIDLSFIPKSSKRAFLQSIPNWLDELGIKTFGKILWEKEIESLNKKAFVYLRINTLKTSTLDVQKKLNKQQVDTFLVPGFPDTLGLSQSKNLINSELYKNGWFEIQDINSQRVSIYTNPKPGMFVIDACTGSGGKALHLATIMQNKGCILAIDPSDMKRKQLEMRSKRNGISIITNDTSENYDIFKKNKEAADIVLIDAPCSGLGVLKRNPLAKWHMDPKRINLITNLQQEIIQKYSILVTKGGILVYATCSIFPNENQDQIKNFLKTKNGKLFRLLDQKTFLTHKSKGDGFYIAKLLKTR